MSHQDMWLEKRALSFGGLSMVPFEVSVALQAMSSSELLTLATKKTLARSSRLLLHRMA